MIDPSSLPTWTEIFTREGLRALRCTRGRCRGECPLCGSRTGLSADEERGLWRCFSCNKGGDKITFVRELHGYDFRDAMRYCGLETTRPPAPDPELQRERRIREGLRRWARETGRRLRHQYYARTVLLPADALDLLRYDPEDELAWRLLAYCFRGTPIEYLEEMLDEIDLARDDRERATAYEMWRCRNAA